MSMWRKTVLATAIVGAGLASTTGAAFAGESQDSGHDKSSSNHEDSGQDKGHHKGDDKGGKGGKSCDNEVAAENGGNSIQEGLLNVDDVQTIAPINACNNDIPVNVLGVQVPIQDLAANIPVLSGSDDDGGNSALAG